MTADENRTATKIAKKNGNKIFESKITVSADGKTKTEVQTMYDMAPRPIEMTTHSSLVVSNHAEDTIFKISGKTLQMSDRMGRSFFRSRPAIR